jgi:hypothetical protein
VLLLAILLLVGRQTTLTPLRYLWMASFESLRAQMCFVCSCHVLLCLNQQSTPWQHLIGHVCTSIHTA